MMTHMSHPKMFDDDDPVLARVRAIALGLPGAQEKTSHGRPTFFTTKVFCYYGGSVKQSGGYASFIQHDAAVLFLPEEGERPALVDDARCFVPAYLGPYGWLGLDVADDTDWTEIAELLETSFRLTAGKRLIAELGTRCGEPKRA